MVLAALRAVKPELWMYKSLRALCVLSSLFAAATAHADNWPARLIKATIPFGAGSAADVVPRLVFERLAAELGQSIVVENRAGARRALRSAPVAEAGPYGYRNLATALPLIRDGQVRALVVSTAKRVADLPDVPTPVEIGLNDADSAIWFGVFVPAKTPRDIVEKLHAAGEKVLTDPAMQASLKKLGIEPMPMKPADMDDLVKREVAANLELIKAAGIKP